MGSSTLQQIINYSIGANFAFDPNLIEFVGSVAKLKDLIPFGATFHTKFETKDGNWGNGVLVGTLNGAATISDGVLNLTAANSFIQFDDSLNMPSGNRGCVRFLFTPNYTGAPANTNILFASSKDVSVIDNMVRIQQIGSLIRYDIYNDSGIAIITSQTGNAFNAVAGQTFEFELNWDADTGTHRLFIDGVQVGATTAGTGTIGNRGFIRLGENFTGVNPGSNGTFDDLVIFDDTQHTANYTPLQNIPYQFSKDGPSIINNSGVVGDALGGLVLNLPVSNPTNSSLQFIINLNGQDKYWDGDSWENSDGSISQSNTLTVVVDNKDELELSLGFTIKIKVILISTSGSENPEVETITLDYNFFNTQSQPPTCTVWGFYRDVSGKGVEGATVTFSLKRSEAQYREAGDSILEKPVELTTDISGRFESDLVRSSSFESGGEYLITIKKTDDTLNTSFLDAQEAELEFIVPDSVDVNITDLITSVI